MRLVTALCYMVFIFPLTAAAQDTGGAARQVWVQIEAQPTLAEARARTAKAQAELVQVLSIPQEVELVLLGILE